MRFERKLYIRLMWIALSAISLTSCFKKTDYIDSIYPESVDPAISFLKGDPSPSEAQEGTLVTYGVLGLPAVINGTSFYINQVKAEMVSYGDSSVTLRVPAAATSGALQIITADGQYYLGPVLSIKGNISVDETFDVGVGTNGAVNDVIQGPDSQYVMVGSFTSYNGYPTDSKSFVNRIAKVNKETGAYMSSFNSLWGADGSINTALYLSSGYYLVGGAYSTFSLKNEAGKISRLFSDGSLDTTTYSVSNVDPTKENVDTALPTFNASFTGGYGGVLKLFKDPNQDAVIVIGNYGTYIQYDFGAASTEIIPYYQTTMAQISRLSFDGVLDSSYNFNAATGKSYSGVSGYVNDALQLSNGKIIIVGSFISFNGSTANNIVAIDANGNMDNSFQFGSGADNSINKITYNANTHKIMLIGNFKTFNGVACKGVVMLNEDGSVDNSFSLSDLGNGYVSYAGQLNNGLILVSGTFQKYQNVVRQGFMILNSDGSLAGNGLNNTGAFIGSINKIIETKTTLGLSAVTLFGNFSMFDNTQYNNVVRIQFAN